MASFLIAAGQVGPPSLPSGATVGDDRVFRYTQRMTIDELNAFFAPLTPDGSWRCFAAPR